MKCKREAASQKKTSRSRSLLYITTSIPSAAARISKAFPEAKTFSSIGNYRMDYSRRVEVFRHLNLRENFTLTTAKRQSITRRPNLRSISTTARENARKANKTHNPKRNTPPPLDFRSPTTNRAAKIYECGV